MKRKQFASLLLAGVLAVGTLPGMVYAETENAAAVQSIETESSDENSSENDTTDTIDSSQETPADTPADPTPTPANTPAAQETTPAAAVTSPTSAAVAASPAAASEEASDDSKESDAEAANEESTEESAFEALLRAIEEAPEGTETQISVTDTIEISQEITIPADKKIVLVPADDKGATLKRSNDFSGDLFVLEKNASLTIQGTTENAGITIDGNKENTTDTEGSLIFVQENATLTLGDFVTLQNNKTTASGGAVRCDKGSLILRSTTIKDNQAQYGGAICSTGTIQIGDETCTDGVALIVSGNKNEANEDDNLYLLGEDASIEVQSPLKESSEIGVSVSDTSRTDAVIKTTEDTLDLEKDVLPYITAEQEGCSIDSEGKLSVEISETPTPTVTATPKPTPTSTPVPTATVTPKLIEITKVAWVNKDSISITFKNYLNKAGSAYYAIVPDGSTLKKLDTSGTGISVAANGTVTFTINNSDQEQVIPEDGIFRVYLQVIYKDSAKTRSQIYPIKITQDKRPTPTPTPAPTTRAPLVYSASDSTVTGLSGKITAYAKKLHYFTVVGAGTDNTDPQEGDVKWEPQYWKAGSTKHNEGRNGNFYMIFAKDYTEDKDITIKVNYKKYIYRNGSWQEAGEEDVPYTITVTPSTAEEDPELQTGAGTIATPETLAEEGVTISENATPSSNATTDDTTPLGMWFATLITALAAAGFVLYRKRI
jgi:predicted outer membrane repeat protein